MYRSNVDVTPLRDVEQEKSTVSWEKFYVILAGRTKGAHLSIVAKLKSSGHTEVGSPEKSDYFLLFCPVASRVGTDISEALETVPGGKPIILVVMHHTFDRNCVVAESRRQVNNQNVRLTVDYLFHEGKLLTCSRNDDSWSEIKRFLGVSGPKLFFWQTCESLCGWLCNRWGLAAAVVALIYILTRGSKEAVTDGSMTEH